MSTTPRRNRTILSLFTIASLLATLAAPGALAEPQDSQARLDQQEVTELVEQLGLDGIAPTLLEEVLEMLIILDPDPCPDVDLPRAAAWNYSVHVAGQVEAEEPPEPLSYVADWVVHAARQENEAGECEVTDVVCKITVHGATEDHYLLTGSSYDDLSGYGTYHGLALEVHDASCGPGGASLCGDLIATARNSVLTVCGGSRTLPIADA